MTVERPPKTAREAILRAAGECRRIALKYESGFRVATARDDTEAARVFKSREAGAKECEQAVRNLIPRRPRGRPKS